MKEEFVKEYKIEEKSKEDMNAMLIQNIMKTNHELENARRNYEFAEGELIDYYLYQMKANQSKLNYLIKKSKANNIEIKNLKESNYNNLHYGIS